MTEWSSALYRILNRNFSIKTKIDIIEGCQPPPQGAWGAAQPAIALVTLLQLR